MSRSRRKTPIFGNTTSHSEKQDKKIWHSRLRAKERTVLSSSRPPELEDKAMPEVRDASNPWSMNKDGHQWWPVPCQATMAERLAHRRGHSPGERLAIRIRLLRKWMAK